MKKFATLRSILMLLAFMNPSLSFTSFDDIFGSATKVGGFIAKDLANLVSSPKVVLDKATDVGTSLLSPAKIFDASKQLIAGLPFEVLASAIHAICSQALSSNVIQPKILPDIDQMQFQLRAQCKRQSIPLLRANEMWKMAEFDPSKKVVILATGWSTSINDSVSIDVFAKAFRCRGDINFVAVDVARYVDTLYTWSALNTDILGKYIAEGLKFLIDVVPVKNIHLIGHSLGAHIMGAAGRQFQEMTHLRIPRITGLDPANPCFNEGDALSGLMRGDADFVDIIHSNSNVLGKGQPMGDADFYPGGLKPLADGCLTVACSHERAWQYFAETIYPDNERNFEAYRCSSLAGVEKGECRFQSAFMGYAVANDIKGNYFMMVNENPPYGLGGSARSAAVQENCGACPYY
ncbi:vitellogenin-1-like [Glossina fuscipes]|uniref:Vitellogenin-1-like n=1 Tax=Glossina fuscipes TaxID=7396 RepID=A0A9C5YVW6_9MUSC|nr:vitellogenin-1-like [Glossina fuscipes]